MFPQDFLIGAATSSYQIEGEIYNTDWYIWEKLGHIVTGEPCGKACNSWELYEKDVQLVEEFGLNAYRMSIEWARVFPEENVIDFDALAHYKEYLATFKDKGIKTFVTLHHFTTPIWMYQKGSWENKEVIKEFLKYAYVVGRELGDNVDAWMTINEPGVVSVLGYFTGIFPPGKNSVLSTIRVTTNQLIAHAETYKLLKKLTPNVPVGIVKNITWFYSLNLFPLDKYLAWFINKLFNDNYLRGIRTGKLPFSQKRYPGLKGSIDFWGLNYYTHVWISQKLPNMAINHLPNAEKVTQTGWEWDSEGLLRAIQLLWDTLQRPIYITENGIATLKDEERVEYIKEHLAQVLEALKLGIPVKGYFYWSLIDNFEWLEGYIPKFGLAGFDHKTFERQPRKSGYFLGEILKTKKLF